MAMEGLLGMVWGGGRWFVSGAASRLLGGGQSLPRGLLERGIRSEKKGEVYSRGPPRVVFPDGIEIGGKRFTGGGEIEVYENSVGALVNSTDIWVVLK